MGVSFSFFLQKAEAWPYDLWRSMAPRATVISSGTKPSPPNQHQQRTAGTKGMEVFGRWYGRDIYILYYLYIDNIWNMELSNLTPPFQWFRLNFRVILKKVLWRGDGTIEVEKPPETTAMNWITLKAGRYCMWVITTFRKEVSEGSLGKGWILICDKKKW